MQTDSRQLVGKIVLIGSKAGGLGAASARHIVTRGGRVMRAGLLDEHGDKQVGMAATPVTPPASTARRSRSTEDEPPVVP